MSNDMVIKIGLQGKEVFALKVKDEMDFGEVVKSIKGHFKCDPNSAIILKLKRDSSVVTSMEQLRNLYHVHGQFVYEASVATPPPASEEKKAEPTCELHKPYRLSPRIMGEMFKRFLSSDPSVIEIADLVRREKKTMMSGSYGIEDYAGTIAGVEAGLTSALANNLFLMDIEAGKSAEGDNNK